MLSIVSLMNLNIFTRLPHNPAKFLIYLFNLLIS